MENNEWQIDTPVEDLIIEIEWQAMVDAGKELNNGEDTRR